MCCCCAWVLCDRAACQINTSTCYMKAVLHVGYYRRRNFAKLYYVWKLQVLMETATGNYAQSSDSWACYSSRLCSYNGSAVGVSSACYLMSTWLVGVAVTRDSRRWLVRSAETRLTEKRISNLRLRKRKSYVYWKLCTLSFFFLVETPTTELHCHLSLLTL
jgi:hypothetical protein